ncbi:hypothetical protein [Shewanella sp. NIFS-20-20]|uniref:hypothetical protein n=1 Tax=Shewanella sp. NIFS-20-20 TaxID=2853806 RepID=UPI001C44C8D3|nr:hypothetical protein [Shewanella sp. NIFS-20-20]MBV7315916.1 hypothetical protein [Shewanella sp. NIFS-20-20]
MKLRSIVAVSILISWSSVANDEVAIELPMAPEGELISMIQVCQDMAIEQQVEQINLDSYLLECVNEQLEELDYSPLEALPQSE